MYEEESTTNQHLNSNKKVHIKLYHFCMCSAHCALPNCEIRNKISRPLMFQVLKTTMSMPREDVEKPARIPAGATVSPVGLHQCFWVIYPTSIPQVGEGGWDRDKEQRDQDVTTSDFKGICVFESFQFVLVLPRCSMSSNHTGFTKVAVIYMLINCFMNDSLTDKQTGGCQLIRGQ